MLPILNIAICDPSEEDMDALRACILRVTMREDARFDARILMAATQPEMERLRQSASLIHIAMVNVERALSAGEAIALENPQCLILLYAQAPVSLEDLLYMRPAAYHSLSQGMDALDQKLYALCERVLCDRHMFLAKQKSGILSIAYTNILYFESSGKYVLVHTRDGHIYHVYGQLAILCADAPKHQFLRIHQSYLVNLRRIERLNKTAKLACLDNGESLPVSDTYIKSAQARVAHSV